MTSVMYFCAELMLRNVEETNGAGAAADGAGRRIEDQPA